MGTATPTAKSAERAAPTLARELGLLDCVLLLACGIIGSAIFLTPASIAAAVPHPAMFLAVWVTGGIITVLACLPVAELGAMYPEAGGQYVYLREAYGNVWAFLFGWMNFAVSITGTIAALSVGFTEYLGAIVPQVSRSRIVFSVGGWNLSAGSLVALAAIAVLTFINVIGIRRAAILQNLAGIAKVGALAAFIVLGLTIGKGSAAHFSSSTAMNIGPGLSSRVGVALIAVFWAYDGWIYLTYVAGEIKNPQKNLPRGLLAGVGVVGAVYVLTNVVYLYALPIPRIAETTAVAQVAASVLFSPAVGTWMALLVAVSCFGAANSAILSGARVHYAVAHDGLFFHSLSRLHPRWRTPALSLIVQAVWAAVLTLSGRYDQLFTYVIFMMVISYAACVAAVVVLRRKRPDLPRPYRCPGYPWIPIAYVLISSVWALNTAWQRPKEALAGTIVVLVGLPAYWYWSRTRAGAGKEDRPGEASC